MEIGALGVLRPATEDYAEEAIKAVKAGKVIAVPTDTLYGFACDAWYVLYSEFFLYLRSRGLYSQTQGASI